MGKSIYEELRELAYAVKFFGSHELSNTLIRMADIMESSKTDTIGDLEWALKGKEGTHTELAVYKLRITRLAERLPADVVVKTIQMEIAKEKDL